MTSPDRPLWPPLVYSVKRDGVSVTNCDSEPVQTPGCVQAHGALLVLRPHDLTVAQASENAVMLLGRPDSPLDGVPVSDLIGSAGAESLRKLLVSQPLDANPTYAFTLPADSRAAELDVTAHLSGGSLVLEFETAGRSAGSDAEYYPRVRTAVARMQAHASVSDLCGALAEQIREVTGLDRVMVYRFHPDLHGEVVAESRRTDLEPFLGLHYPAEDIPAPARAIFMKLWVRPVPDVEEELAELTPLAHPDTGRPPDMTHCALRGPSVMYTEYLRNMGVRAAVTMPLRWGDTLWGLVAGHHYSGPFPAPFPLRAALEFLAQVASLQLQAAVTREQEAYRLGVEAVHAQAVARAAADGELPALLEGQPELLRGLAAGGVALLYRDRWWTVGEVPPADALPALGEWLNARPEFLTSRPLYSTDSLAAAYPPAAAFASSASGVLAFPLSRTRGSLLAWFRPEAVSEVTWAGDPAAKPMVPGPHGPRLTPRGSFAMFVEQVRHRSRRWLSGELDAAARLRVQIMELVVSRAERLADLNADLTRSNEELDAFAYVASHDLKEPLRGINKYACQLLDEAELLADEHRRKLEALTRLTVRMDSLLDALLHFSRVGRAVLERHPIPLDEVLGEAIEMVDARRVGAVISVERPLPEATVDRVRVREVFVNLLSNALKYNSGADKRVEVGYVTAGEPADRTGWPLAAVDHTVYFVRDNGIGIEPRHHADVFKIFKRLHAREAFGGGTGAGLTIVKRLVERHGGTVWVESSPGAGTTFRFTLDGDENQ